MRSHALPKVLIFLRLAKFRLPIALAFKLAVEDGDAENFKCKR